MCKVKVWRKKPPYFKRGDWEEGGLEQRTEKRSGVRENSKLQVPSKEMLVKTGCHSDHSISSLYFSFTLDGGGKDRTKLGGPRELKDLFCSSSFLKEGTQSGFNL